MAFRASYALSENRSVVHLGAGAIAIAIPSIELGGGEEPAPSI
jgi:hypothetical protein